MAEGIFIFLCFVLPMLGLVFLGYFAISKWANSGAHRQLSSDEAGAPTDQTIEARLATAQSPDSERRPPAPMTTRRPKVKLTKELRARARADYEAARGTAHLRLLKTAQTALAQQLQDAEDVLQKQKKDIAITSKARDVELRQTLIRQRVEAELPSLPGIGPRLSSSIIKQVFHGDLSDLRNASSVDGIGPQKQTTIDRWTWKQVNLLPTLLAADFPGKEEILHRHDKEIRRLTAEIDKTEAIISDRTVLLGKVRGEIIRLSTVPPGYFVALLENPSLNADKVNRYLLGSFAPWEPMPDWFAAAVGTGSQDPDIRILHQPPSNRELSERIVARNR